MTAVVLRPYQDQALYLTNRALNALEHPLCVLPTGGGKSLVLAGLIAQRKQPTLVLSHMRELLEQDSVALRSIAPDIKQGFFSAGLKEKRGHMPVVFGSVQTVYRSLAALGTRTLIIIDEAHLCPRKADAMYAKVFAHFKLALRAGFTATNERLDSGSLTGGPDAWFTNVACDVPVAELIKQKFLVPLAGILTEHQANLDGVGSRAGDFVAEQAERAVTATLSITDVIQDVIKLASHRRNWLLFAPGVEHAKKVLAELLRCGIDAALVIGDTPSAERAAIIKRFKSGDLRALVNVGVLTTGFDAPQTDCIVSMRPTKSGVLWQQIMGRGMRVYPNKKSCLLLDFVGNLERLGGCGCVVKMKDERLDISGAQRERAARRAMLPRDDPEFMQASLADPMKSGASFACKVVSMEYQLINSKRFTGKQMVIAIYHLADENGSELKATSFVAVEYPGASRFHSMRWFMRRGMIQDDVPSKARDAMGLAKILPEPSECVVYWDTRLKCYLVMEERFATTPAPFSQDVPA